MVPRTTSSGLQLDDRRLVGPGIDLGEEHLGAEPAGLEELLADGRQADVVGGLDVVVADDRQVVGDMQPGLVRGRDDAERLGVAGREDRGRPVDRAVSIRRARSRAS